MLNQLTDREKQIFFLTKKGLSHKEIGEILHLSIDTVKRHLNRIYIKTGITNKLNLILFGYTPSLPFIKSWNSEIIRQQYISK